MSAERRAKGLGWFSIGLGVGLLGATRSMARAIGVEGPLAETLMRAVGVRELASGVGILTRPRSSGWVWSRVVGDMIDLALLGSAFGSRRNDRGRLAFATANVAAVALVDALTARQLGKQGRRRTPARHAIASSTPPR